MAMTPAQFVGAPPPLPGKITATRQHFQAMDNFFQVFAVRPGERLLMLTDPLLDPGVVQAVQGLCLSRGVHFEMYMAPNTTLPAVAEAVVTIVALAGMQPVLYAMIINEV